MSALFLSIVKAAKLPLILYRQHRIRVLQRRATENDFREWLIENKSHWYGKWFIEQAFRMRDEIVIMSLTRLHWQEYVSEDAAFFEAIKADRAMHREYF